MQHPATRLHSKARVHSYAPSSWERPRVCTFMQMCLRCRQNWELNNALEYSNRCSHRHIYIMRHQGQYDFSPLSCMSVHVVKLHRRENDNFESPKRQRCNHNQHGLDMGNRAELNLKQYTYDFFADQRPMIAAVDFHPAHVFLYEV